ncbi:hypothetical protein [Streptosporangium sp. NPDC020145]|uniref:hypothetical protein n=1 Tax=Streptosporangium sp. NPDC020145 TaxID=3154694 RepID=UPI00341DB5B6
MLVVERHQQPAQDDGTPGTGLTVQVEGPRRGYRGDSRLGRRPFHASRHGAHELSGVVEVAAPQQSYALAGQPVRGVGGEPVVGDQHAGGRWRAVLGTPESGPGLAALGPVNREHSGLLMIEPVMVMKSASSRCGRSPAW